MAYRQNEMRISLKQDAHFVFSMSVIVLADKVFPVAIKNKAVPPIQQHCSFVIYGSVLRLKPTHVTEILSVRKHIVARIHSERGFDTSYETYGIFQIERV